MSSNRPILEIDLDNILVYNKKYTITGLRELNKEVLLKLEALLFNRLIGLDRSLLPSLDLKDIADNRFLNIPTAYLTDLSSSLEPFRDFLVRVLLDSRSALYSRYIRNINPATGKPRFKASKIAEFFSIRKEFLELLALAIYINSGSPLRGEELVLITYRNSRDSLRNIILDRESKLISITTRYYKSYNITREDKENIRFLSPTLSLLVVYYLVYIIPLYEYFNIEYLERSKESFSYLLLEDRGNPISSTTLSTTLFRESSTIFREGLTLNPYRHLIDYIIKRRLGYELGILEDDLEDSNREREDLVNQLANRSTKVGRINYGLEVDLLGSKNRDFYNKSLEFSKEYFKFFNLSRNILTLAPISSLLNPTQTIDYNITSSVRTREVRDSRVIRDLELTRPDLSLEEYLRRFFNKPTSTFKDRFQKEAIEAIVNRNTYTTYINRTGSGKSLIYFLPAYIYPNRISIVLTPRLSLKNDLYKRGLEKNLSISILENLDLSEDFNQLSTSITLISIESILDERFTRYIYSFIKEKAEVTIFLDEAHVLILENNFRYILKYINSLLKFRIPLVFISATLPNPLLNLLEKEFFLTPNNNKVIRAPTSRDNISYNIIYRDDKLKEEDNILNIIDILRSKGLSSSKKALVFINSTKKGLVLSKNLGLDFYYSNNPDKDIILERFLEDNTKSLVLLTTSSLAIGLDYTIIGFTLHLTPLYSLVDYIQESSRIRNNGYSYILDNRPRDSSFTSSLQDSLSSIDISKIETIEDFKELDKAFLRRLLLENRCLRRVINLFLDNNSTITTCDLAVEIPCYLCNNRDILLQTKAIEEENSLRESTLGLLELEKKLVSFTKDFCLFCLLVKRYKPSISLGHTITTCSKAKSSILVGNMNIFSLKDYLKNRITSKNELKPNSCCYICLFPSRICARLKEENDSSPSCIYPDLLYLLFTVINFFIKAKEEQPFYGNPRINDSLGSDGPFREYLLSPITIYNIDAIRLVEILSKVDYFYLISRIEERDTLKEVGLTSSIRRSSLRESSSRTEPSSSSTSITKRPRTPPNQDLIISDIIRSPNPRDKKRSKE